MILLEINAILIVFTNKILIIRIGMLMLKLFVKIAIQLPIPKQIQLTLLTNH